MDERSSENRMSASDRCLPKNSAERHSDVTHHLPARCFERQFAYSFVTVSARLKIRLAVVV